MDKKPIQEDSTNWLASEPAGVAMTEYTQSTRQRITIPQGMPQSVSEALSDIDEGEKEFERGETFTHREVMQSIWDKIAGYAG